MGMKNFFGRSRSLRELKQLCKEYAELDKPLCVMDDAVFKAMLSSNTDDSREALRSLLCACTRREISSVQVTHNDLLPAHLEGKSPRLDVHATFNDGEAAILEMQIEKSDDDLKTRACTYTAMLQSGQSKRGKPYKDIRRVYQIFFLNCVLFPDSPKLPRRYSYREEEEHDRLTEATEIIFYEMPKLEKRVKDYLEGRLGTEDLQEDEKWCIYMKYHHERLTSPLVEELCREEGIMHAEKTLTKVSRDYQRFARNLALDKNWLDLMYAKERSRKQGLEEGLEQGRKEKLEIARRLKLMGIPIEQIAEGTGLSIDEIAKL